MRDRLRNLLTGIVGKRAAHSMCGCPAADVVHDDTSWTCTGCGTYANLGSYHV